MRQSDGTDTLDFTYDADGKAIGFTYDSGMYFYLYNLQGDVTAVMDASGDIAAQYTYDAWGNVLSAAGSMASINPIRYRGYYYDTETGYYCLQSRYYAPEWSRFLNADRLLIAGDALTAANMYAYCNNNPVMYTDHTGELALLKRLVSAVVNVLKTVVDKVTGKAIDKIVVEEKGTPEAVKAGAAQKADPAEPDYGAASQVFLRMQAFLDAIMIILPFLAMLLYLFDRPKPVENPWTLERELENCGNGIDYQPNGLAVGSTYCYSFEVRGSNTEHRLYRIHKTNKSLQPMKNVDPLTKAELTDSNRVELGHANDVALAAFENGFFMYVVTFAPTNEIIKLEYDGAEYWQVARYTYNLVPSGLGSGTYFNGISLIGNTNDNKVEFLLQAYDTFYRVKIPFAQAGGQIYPTNAFSITKPSGYGRQTFHYTPSQDKMHVVFADKNTNVVQAYTGISSNTPQLVNSWDINSTDTFEVEGGGLHGGTYWFTTYEGISISAGGKNGGLFTHSHIN